MDPGKRMFMVVAGIALVALVVFGVMHFTHGNSSGDHIIGTTAPFDAATAFAIRCAGCHGAGGSGGTGPRLSGGAVIRDFPNIDDQVKFVTNGKPPMPAFGKNHGLTADEIRAIVVYTRTVLNH